MRAQVGTGKKQGSRVYSQPGELSANLCLCGRCVCVEAATFSTLLMLLAYDIYQNLYIVIYMVKVYIILVI